MAQVEKWSNVQVITPVIDTVAYSINDSVGGKLTLTGVTPITNGSVMLDTISLSDKSTAKAAMTILFFRDDPSGSTLTNNSAISIVAADTPKVVGYMPIVVGDYTNVNGAAGPTIVTKTNVGIRIPATGNQTLYVALFTTGTPTYAVGDLTLTLGFS